MNEYDIKRSIVKYMAGAETARQCVARLKEHYESITLNVSYTDAAGNEIALEIEWSEDDDDDDKDKA